MHAHGVSVALPAAAPRTADEQRHRADRRRRPVVASAAAARPARQAAVSPAHRVARAGSGRQRSTPEFRAPDVQLWLGRDAHLVHYPVKAGALINIVAIVDDDLDGARLERAGRRATNCSRTSRRGAGAQPARDLLALPERWHKWALYDLPPLRPLGRRAGDAAGGRRPPDAAVPRPGRRDGDRGCRGACRLHGAARPTTSRRRCGATSGRGGGAPRRVQSGARSNGRTYHIGGGGSAAAQHRSCGSLGGKLLLRALRLAL